MDYKKPSSFKILLPIIIVFFIAYLPIISFQFAIKHDFFQAYFPMKYFLSEAIKAGELPLWNPFLNYGFPIYGDMSESYWNPLTWLIAWTGYTPYTFTMEQLFYMFLAGISMYKLSGIWIHTHQLRLISAITYMCCGFMVAHMQHFNWITAVGLLPACFYTFYRFINAPSVNHLLLGACIISFFISSVHPGMIIGLLYALLPFFFLSKKANDSSTRVLIKRLVPFCIAIVLLSIGVMVGYWEVLPHTNRSSLITVEQMKAGSTHFSSIVSLLFPMAVHTQNFSSNDLALRNCFIGIIPLTGLLMTLRFTTNSLIRTFISAGVIFIFLSSPLALPIYRYIPLIQFIRLNGELRLFGLLFFNLAGMIMIEKQQKQNPRSIQQTLKLIFIFCAVIFLAALFFWMQTKSMYYPHISNWKLQLKSLLHNSRLVDLMLIQSAFTLFLIMAYIFKNGWGITEKKNVLLIVSLEAIGMVWLCLPFTAVGMRSVTEYQKLLAEAPGGIIKNYQLPEKEVTKSYPPTEKLIGGWGFYSKVAALPENLYYPLFLKENLAHFNIGTYKRYNHRPFSFMIKDTITPNLKPKGFSTFHITVKTFCRDTLVIKQNYFPGWLATSNNSKIYSVVPVQGNWIGIPLSTGNHSFTLKFQRPFIYSIFLFQQIMVILIGIYLVIHYLIRYILPYPARK